jgi:hypothetical protein
MNPSVTRGAYRIASIFSIKTSVEISVYSNVRREAFETLIKFHYAAVL